MPSPARLILNCVALLTLAPQASTAPVDFNRDIRPLLSSRCYPCHGPDEASRKAKLRLDRRQDALEDRNGVRALIPGNPSASALLQRITTHDPDDLMPPPKAGPRLSDRDAALIRDWITEGAPYSEHWAWTPPQRPKIPGKRPLEAGQSPIDGFVRPQVVRAGLRPSPPADRATLIRRVTLDLTGLPPTPQEVEAFAAERDPAAYERLVDRLLISPAYGERWARVWLDLARYADSAGLGSDPLRPNLWPWRDWVIEAFNRNLPFDQFTLEQLAGDLLPNATQQQHIATAFHRNTMTNTEGGTDDEEYRIAAVKDRLNTTGQVWMGLTVGCAQCHSHKYDPLSQGEYYQLFAFFNQTEDHDQPDERPTLPLPTPAQRARLDALQARVTSLEQQRATTPPDFAQELATWIDRQRQGFNWQPLRPDHIAATRGSTLETLDDGSLLARHTAPDTDTYTLRIPLQLTNLSALRLELLPHDSLPNQGPGRGPNGRMVLTEIEAAWRAPEAPRPQVRFVRVELPGPGRVLSLAEVQVLLNGTNVASGAAARQSTTHDTAEARLALDGNPHGDLSAGSVASTKPETDPWWEVDLGTEQPLEEIAVWNRTDRGLGTRLSDFKILALDQHRKTVWERPVGTPPNPVARFRLPPETSLKLQPATADTEESGFAISQAVDGSQDPKNGWAPGGEPSLPHTAVFEIASPPTFQAGGTLWVSLIQKHGTNQLLGRFRLTATADAPPIRQLPANLQNALALTPEQRSPSQNNDLADYFREFAPCLAQVNAELRQARQDRDGVKPVALPVMRELPADKRRTTRLLHKGNFLDPGDTVEPGVPTAFHAWPAGAPTNRLGLARWIVSRDNPLTARVTVNRIWAQLFGTGIVETEEDFGTQGSLPSHPELLDWLAVEFMDQGWNLKALIRSLVLSDTYRQSSRATPAHLELDPRNQLLARASRRRLEAEMIRDQALALSGLLSPKIGGPSVFPPQPEGLWRAAFNGERTWSTSTGEDRYRRALYVFLRRTVPYPSLSTFDAPSRETCTLRRLPTNTPLQAFVTLNDPVFVECSQALARRILRESGPDIATCLRYGFRLCVGRSPSRAELRVLQQHFERELAHYQERPDAAQRLATDPLGPLWPNFSPAEAAAWTSVANVLLNLDAVLNRG